MISCTSPRAATTRRYAGIAEHRLEQRSRRLQLGHGLEQRREADPSGGRRAVTAEVDQPGLAGQHHDRVHVVDVVGHRDDVGLDHVRAVRVQRRRGSRRAAPARPPASRPAGRAGSSRAAGAGRPSRCDSRAIRSGRSSSAYGVVELTEPVVQGGQRGVVLAAVLADVERGEAEAHRGGGADQPQDRPVGGQPVAAGAASSRGSGSGRRAARRARGSPGPGSCGVPSASRSRVRCSRTRT